MQNLQTTPLQSKLKTTASLLLVVACAAALYAASSIKTSTEDIFPMWTCCLNNDIPICVKVQVLTTIAAIIYGGAALLLYFKRKLSVSAILSIITCVSIISIVMYCVWLDSETLPTNGGYFLLHMAKIGLSLEIMAITGFVSALLAAFNMRLRKRTFRALDPEQKQLHKAEFRKAQIARVLTVIVSIIALGIVILIFYSMSLEPYKPSYY